MIDIDYYCVAQTGQDQSVNGSCVCASKWPENVPGIHFLSSFKLVGPHVDKVHTCISGALSGTVKTPTVQKRLFSPQSKGSQNQVLFSVGFVVCVRMYEESIQNHLQTKEHV